MRRHRNPLRFRKARQSSRPDRSAFSTSVRSVRDSVQRRRLAGALGQIEQLLSGALSIPQRTQLLSLAGDTLFKQGKFDEAAQAFARGTQMASEEARAWHRPWLAEARSLLKSGNTAGAIERATALFAKAVSAETAFAQIVSQAQATLKRGTPVTIPPRPPRASVVASRLGRMFFLEGELVAAQQLFASAVQANPNGGARARLGLAEIALRRGDGAEATRLTKEALRLGQFKAKTLSGWPLLFAACRQTGTDPLDPALLSGLAQAAPSVRARANLLLVRQLRQQGDARWQTLANNWLNGPGTKPSVVVAELRKILLAHGRRLNQPAVGREVSARALLAVPGLGPVERLSAIKELVRAQLESNQIPALEPLIAAAPARIQPDLTHSLALVCLKSGKTDLARVLFERNLASQPPGSGLWGKTLWAKARLLKGQGRPAEAAALFWTCYQQPGLPERFRWLSLVEWTRALGSVSRNEVLAMQPQIEAAYPVIQDYELVLDLARQVRFSRLRSQFGSRIFERGRTLATQAFENAGHPSAAATILFKFCRRANDFTEYGSIIRTWEAMPPAKRIWLWSTKGDYWGWIELVLRAYRDSGQVAAAEAFATAMFSDSSLPAEAHALLGANYAAMKIKQGNFTAAFSVYERMTKVAPSHEWTSAAYYWLGVRAWKRGDRAAAADYGARMSITLGSDLGLLWKQRMAANAHLLRIGMDSAGPPPGVSARTFTQQSAAIQAHLERLPL